MDWYRRLAGSMGPVVVAFIVAGGVTQSYGLGVVSHLQNGERIFLSGVTADGRVVENSHGMRGVGCMMCHGADGRGGSMHGIPAPNITFSFLTDPRGYEHATGRRRPAYNEETIKAAVVAGIDAGGNTLHPEMPRWTGLTIEDLGDLIAYLRSLDGTEQHVPQESYFL